MRLKLIIICTLLSFIWASCQQEDLPTQASRDDFSVVPVQPTAVKGQVKIKFQKLDEDLQCIRTRSGELTISHAGLNEAAKNLGITRVERLFPYAGKFEARTRKSNLHLWYTVYFDEQTETSDAVKTLSAIADIAQTEPVWHPQTDAAVLPYNDPYLPQQWHLFNPGGNGMLAGADIDMLEAWEIEKGKPEVIVAVIDRGVVDMNHEDLKDNLWINEGEYGKDPWTDNDGNGIPGDWHGLNANGVGANPYRYTPNDGEHPTHVAGILAAKNNNGIGVCGIVGGDGPDNGIRIMTCSYNEPAQAIKYAADNGAVICTNSWHAGTDDGTQQWLQDAIDYFVTYAGIDENGNQTGPMKGGLVFASAGNDGTEPDKVYPASLNHVIAVAALGPNFKKSSYSNYADWVDISAPGGSDGQDWQIWSTWPNNTYSCEQGTSMSTPVAAGVAALIVSKFGGKDSGLEPYEVEFRLLRGVRSIDEYNPDYQGKLGAGCVNAKLALSDEPVNFPPIILPEEEITSKQILSYSEKKEYRFNVSDREDGTDVTYSVNDPSGSVTCDKEGGRIRLTIENQNCTPGDYAIALIVTDQGGITASYCFEIKLHPEFREEPKIEMTSANELTILAGKNFSGKTTVQLYDASGNLVLKQEVNISLSQPGKVDLSGIAGGTYTLKLSCNNKTITKNIIKL